MAASSDDEVGKLKPRTDAELARELHARLSELLGEAADVLNQPQWRHLQAQFALARDATGRWFVTNILVATPAA